MKSILVIVATSLSPSALALPTPVLQARVVPTTAPLEATAIELKNDTYNPSGGQLYLEQGFITGEKAGVWVRVPADVPLFKVDSFRVLMGGGGASSIQIYFQMGISPDGNYATSFAPAIENAAQVTVGDYFNDIPAQGSDAQLPCAKANDLIGAAVEFTQDGLPSVYRDLGPINVQANLLYANPGGWNYSATYGLQGNWVLRVVGHAAAAGECQ